MSSVIVDVDGTVLSEGGEPNEKLISALNASGDDIVIVSARKVDRLEDTRRELDAAGLDFDEIHLNDFEGSAFATGVAFKKYKAELLLEDGRDVSDAIDNDAEVRRVYADLGIDVWSPAEYVAEFSDAERAVDPNGYETTAAIKAEALQGLEWRRVFNRGGTLVGVARARDLSSGKRIPIETVRRMSSYFARHEVDSEAQGWRRGEDGYPSAGRIAWALWGGDPARSWAMSIIRQAAEQDAARSVEVSMGIEFRKANVELRAVDDTGMTFEGYAAVFDSPSAEGTTPEVVKPSAFRRSLAAAERGEWDVRAYQDHDPKLLLGTTKSGTLKLSEDSTGLKAQIRLNPEISWHRDLAALVRSMGKSLGMSFGFWNTTSNRVNEAGVRELRDVKLIEVSALTGMAPYYPGTISTVSVRALADKAGLDLDELKDAVSALLAGEATARHADTLAAAIGASRRDVEGVPTVFGDKKQDEPKLEDPKLDEEVEAPKKAERSLAEDAGIDVAALAAALEALAAETATAEQIAIVAAAARAVVADSETETPAEMMPADPNAPSETMPADAPTDIEPSELAPMDAAPTETESESSGNEIEVELTVKIPRSVPRSIREKQIDLAGRAVQ